MYSNQLNNLNKLFVFIPCFFSTVILFTKSRSYHSNYAFYVDILVLFKFVCGVFMNLNIAISHLMHFPHSPNNRKVKSCMLMLFNLKYIHVIFPLVFNLIFVWHFLLKRFYSHSFRANTGFDSNYFEYDVMNRFGLIENSSCQCIGVTLRTAKNLPKQTNSMAKQSIDTYNINNIVLHTYSLVGLQYTYY